MEERFKKIGIIGKYQEPRVRDEMRELCQYLSSREHDYYSILRAKLHWDKRF